MKWTIQNIPDQTDRVVVVTGANSGIGKETAKQLAAKGATVVLAVRNVNKGEEAKANIVNKIIEADIEVMQLDLASLSSVEKFVDNFKKKYSKLDILVNNAGVMIPPYGKTEDGFELQLGVNHLGHFALTLRLLGLIISTKDSRIVTVSSLAHTSGKMNFNDLQWEDRDYNDWQAYGDSKLANLYFTYELARKLQDTNVRVVAAHPGLTDTNLQQNMGALALLTSALGQKPAKGALPTLRAATDLDVESGDYYGPRGFKEVRGYPVKVESSELSHNQENASQLWQASEQLTQVNFKK